MYYKNKNMEQQTCKNVKATKKKKLQRFKVNFTTATQKCVLSANTLWFPGNY